VLQELALAKRVGKGREDFVLPLKIDDLASDETTIEMTRLNSIDFRGGWLGRRSREALGKAGEGRSAQGSALPCGCCGDLEAGQPLFRAGAHRPQRAAGLQLVFDPVVSAENFPSFAARREEEARSASVDLSIPSVRSGREIAGLTPSIP